MLVVRRGIVGSRIGTRFFSCSLRSFKESEKVDSSSNKLSSLRESFENDKIASYQPQVLSSRQTSEESDSRPVPINVEMNYFKPLKHDLVHGDLKCEITMRSYDNRSMDFFCDFALRTAYYLGIPATGPKPLQIKRERWTVNRAPFVHAKSKENFERHTHARLLRLYDLNPEVVEIFLQYITKHSVLGVGLKANMYIQEGLDYSEKLNELDIKSTELPDSVSGVGNLAHTANTDVADRVKELLNEPHFKRHFTNQESDK